MSDVVYIHGLEVESLIGVYDFERHARQKLILDFDIDFDCAAAGATDDLSLALDYDRLSRLVRDWCAEQTFELIESIGEGLCRLVHQEFGVKRVRLAINKPAAVPGCSAVGTRIERCFE
ncbi:dihydroneopterin aldolase [Reinekea marinisedimentorum]|uniref:7,8-dihydroneopterin aldolase n=1 Tax=Reinekea marinisedimentorum TaxID=230495 RepID=A0A4R3IBQ9_9GAMM|nr:dihydroneopterin aldolase [Reinekea marinisedimentorum]TCS43055.1 dihydroneopterin aldolase [Reinekea marinisedimentorum]